MTMLGIILNLWLVILPVRHYRSILDFTPGVLKVISLLIPSRQRSMMLRDSIKTWKHPLVEILLAIDDNDPEKDEYFTLAANDKRISIFVMKQHGYANLQEYYNFLAKAATGDWLMLGNDDAYMLTEHWVSIIEKEDAKLPQVLNVWNEQDNLFPIISRAWYEAVGHFSRNTHADSWVQQTAELIGKTKYLPGIDIKHHGEELTDETHRAVKGIVGQTSEAYRRMAEERKEDARKVMAYIKDRGLEP